MTFATRMAWRQARGAWRQLIVCGACVALGVAAVVAVGSFAAAVERTLGREARTLMGGDVELRAARPLPAAARAGVAALGSRGAASVDVREMVAMARAPVRGATRLVEVKAVGAGYPLYGRLATSPAGAAAALTRDDAALVQRDVLSRLGVTVGDRINVGDATFTIAGVVEREPDRPASLVALGPRVMIGAAALARTDLVQPGSRIRYRTLLRLPPDVSPAAARETLARAVEDPGVRIVSFDDARPGLRRFFAQLTTYLGLVGLASLLVGGVGVASSMAALVRRQVPVIGVLKALGADSRAIVTIYLVQAQAVALLASLAGAASGAALEPLLARVLAGFLPVALEPSVELWVFARGVAMGLGVTLLCALWPVLTVRDVPPSRVLRAEVDPPIAARRPWIAAAAIAMGLAGLSLAQAGSLKVGGVFVGGAAAAVLVLVALARALGALAARLPRGGGVPWRYGVAALRRPGGQPARVVLALGAGVMLLVAVALLQASLGRQIDAERRQDAPSFFFIDVQSDQRDAFAALVASAAVTPPALTPVVRARLAAIDGRVVTRATVEGRRGEESSFYYTREYILTASSHLPAGNAVTRGRWWAPDERPARPEISVEDVMARRLGLGPGSTLTFDVQGVPIEATIASLRKVDWQSLALNFFVIFSPGALDGAPTTWVATARVAAAREADVQDRVVAAFPNVTAIPVRDVLERVAGVLGHIAVAVRAVAAFTVGTGLVVMVGALAATRYQRLYESVVLRTLGASRGVVARAFAVEYACLGVTAGVGGTALAAALAWIVLRFVLDAPWTLEPRALVAGIALSTALAVAVGFLATYRLLGQKPLWVLRRE